MAVQELERRVLAEQSEVRASTGEDGKTRIEGYAVMFGAMSVDLGGYRERFAPTAFDSVLRTNPDVRALFNHDSNMVLGRTKSGTLRLFADTKGLGYTVSPPESRSDVLEAIQRGDVSGSSFAFTVGKDGDIWVEEEGKLVREVRKVAKLFDVGPVVFPAYPDTSVARRSMEAAALTLGLAVRPLRDADRILALAQLRARQNA